MCPACRVALGFALLLVAAGGSARASTMEVRYSLLPIIRVDSLTTLAPTSAGGHLELAYQATGNAAPSARAGDFHALPGPVNLVSGTLRAALTAFNPPVGMAISGQRLTVRLDFQPAAGTLLAGGTLQLLHFLALANGSIECQGVCTGGVPPGVHPFATDSPLTFAWTAPAHLVGTALDAGALDPKLFVFAAPSFGLELVAATEIDRHFVPEPSSLPLAAGGLALLAGVAARRRRARR